MTRRRAGLWAAAALALAVGSTSSEAAAFEPPADDGWFAGERGFSFQAMLGPSYRNLFGLHIGGVDGEIAFGAQTRVGAFHGRLNALAGSTGGGLTVVSVRAAPTWEAPVGPLRLGIGANLGMLGYVRATNGVFEWAPGAGPRVHLAWDFARGSDVAGFVGVRGGVDFYDDHPAVVPEATLHLGLRLF